MRASPSNVDRLRTSLVAALAACIAALAACTPASAQSASAPNTVPLKVRTPHGGFNRLVVSVTLCRPGTEDCATIDDVMVDTGSTGLRLEASAVPSSLALPAFAGADGKPLAECLRFVHDDAWGPLYRTDLRIGGMVATDLPVQVIADDLRPRPAGCPTSTAKPTSNGTLGVGPHLFDCQGACAQDAAQPGVFVEEAGSWRPFEGAVPAERRLPNPVSRFPGHDNGIVIDLPAVREGGAAEIAGTLTFGVGTAAGGRIEFLHVLRIGSGGRFTTRYGGADYPASLIDSGTETSILADDSLPRCAGMSWAFCVSPARSLDATMVGQDGAEAPVRFRIGDYRGALDRRVGAWDGFAEAADRQTQAFVWGAPFFFGRRVALVFEDKTAGAFPALRGPFYAFDPP